MKKFKITQDSEYVQGHLRTGYMEVVVEAESVEEAKVKAKELLEDAELIVDSYEIDDYEMMDELEAEEIN